jgi:hypothetical protein
MDNTNPERSALGSTFDRVFRALHDVPDVVRVKPATIRHVTAVTELAQTFIVQTARHRDLGDTIFIEYVGTEGSLRIALPAPVAECIVRQRDALTTKSRKRAAKLEASRRKAAGIKPGFLKAKAAKPQRNAPQEQQS